MDSLLPNTVGSFGASSALAVKMPHIPALDGMRAISIALVVFSHYMTPLIPGGLGVTLFFFISGFLIASLLIQEHAEHGQIDYRSFFTRRFLRLYPALIVFLIITVISYYLTFGVYDQLALVSALFYIYNYAQISYDLIYPAPLWSLAVEEHFYILFPFILKFLLDRSVRFALYVVMGLIIFSVLWRLFLTCAMGADWERIYIGSDTRMDSILFGVLLALALRYAASRDFIAKHFGQWTILGSILLIIASLLYREETYRQTLLYTVHGVGMFVAVGGVLFSKPNAFLRSVLENRILCYIGKLSYAAYLYHYIIMAYLLNISLFPSETTTKCVAFALFTLFSILSYHFVEKPMIKFRRIFGSNAYN